MRPGHIFLAYNPTSADEGDYTITDTISHEDTQIVYLVINGEVIETTPEHPFYTLESGWTPAGELTVGDHVATAALDYGTVEQVEVVAQHEQMYNLTIDEAHTFFVGDGQWLVHNACPPAESDPAWEDHVNSRQHGERWYDSRHLDYARRANDVDWRNSSYSVQDALDYAFAQTGEAREDVVITQWGNDQNGHSVPVEWRSPNGAEVSMDLPHLTVAGPDVPHIGFQNALRGLSRIRGHIFLDWVPAGRPPRP